MVTSGVLFLELLNVHSNFFLCTLLSVQIFFSNLLQKLKHNDDNAFIGAKQICIVLLLAS